MRQPNPKSNSLLNLKARNESEAKLISDFKKLALQDEIDMMDLFSECVSYGFKVHHWPPGNPQLQLSSFQEGKPHVIKCKCGKPAVFNALNLKTKEHFDFCSDCFSKVPMRYDAKLWSVISRKKKETESLT